MGNKPKEKPPKNSSEESETAETPPRSVSLRPRGVDAAPPPPLANDGDPGAKATSEHSGEKPSIPLKPRALLKVTPTVELDSDPPEAPDTSGDTDREGSPDLLDEDPPERTLPPEDKEEPPTTNLRPRGLGNANIASIKERAASNTEEGSSLPEAAPAVPVKPRPAKIDPNAEVEVLDEAGEESEDDADDSEEHVRLQDRKTGVTRLISGEEFETESEKLNQQEKPSWERDSQEENAPSEEETMTLLMPSEDGASGYQWVTLSPDDLLSPGARRRRKFFKRAALAIIAFGMLFLAVVFGRHAVLAMRKASALKAEPFSESLTLTPEEITKAEAAARAFAAETDLEALLRTVRTPSRVAPLAQEFYRASPKTTEELGSRLKQKKLITSSGVFVVMAFETEGAESPYRFLTAERTESGPYLIDWELSSGYQEQELERFFKQRPSSPQPLRVVARPDNYYDSNFPIESYACYLLSYPTTDFQLYGYVRRTSQAQDVLLVNTANRSLSMILDLKFEHDPLRDDRVLITDVVRLDWFYEASTP